MMTSQPPPQRPEEVKSVREEYPELGRTGRPYVPARSLNTEYPLIDSDPHFRRVISYARPSDYTTSALFSTIIPGTMLFWERISPSEVGRNGFKQILRLSATLGAFSGFYLFYSRSINRFYGFSENRREVAMDMAEMTGKVKRGEPLYGVSTLTEYMQGVASRQSRYAGVFMHVLPWFNFVNHGQHGVDTAKYYRNAERELEAERRGETVEGKW